MGPLMKVTVITVIVIFILCGCAASLGDRLKSVDQTNDQALLTKFATNDEDIMVRINAIAKLTVQSGTGKDRD